MGLEIQVSLEGCFWPEADLSSARVNRGPIGEQLDLQPLAITELGTSHRFQDGRFQLT